MRKSLLTALCMSLATAPTVALAQNEDQTPPAGDDQAQQNTENDQGAEQQGGETEGAEVVDQKQGDQVKMPKTEGARETAPGETHTVVKGDTLWDLSQQYLGSPWYWPKVWSYNPEIANPHWIYPGNLVRFFPAGEEGPSRVEVGNAPQEMQEDEGVTSPEMMQEEETKVNVSGRIGFVPKGAVRVQKTGFVTRAEVEEAGTIVNTFAEKLMLSYPDTMYVKFKRPSDARVGDNYVIFHTEKEINHPVNGGRVGYLTRVDGTAKILSVDKNVATAQVTGSFDDVRVGYLLGPAGEHLVDYLAPRPNDREMKGYVVASMEPQLTLLGEHQYILIDRGTSDGVQPGNTFTIVRNGHGNFLHPNEEQDMSLPTEPVATCMAVDVKDKTSTCLLIRSIREVVEGDRVEMRAGTRTALR